MDRAKTRVLLLTCALLVVPCSAQSVEPAGAKTAVAIVAGKPLYEEDLLPLIQMQMQQIRNQEYQIKNRALDMLINQRLLDGAAAAKGLSVDALLKQEVEAKTPDPSDGELENYYQSQKDRLNKPLDEVRPQLGQALKMARLAQARSEYVQRLRKQGEVAVLLAPPRVKVGFDTARMRGNPGAPITIVEFSDFQCPFCKQAAPTVTALLARYPDQLRVAYRDFPLTQIHPQAQIAAEASHCAEEQGRFWDYHDELFQNQAKLDAASLAGYARALKLDAERFERCLSSGKFKAAIESDVKEAMQAGVAATPTFFVNGIYLSGAQPLESFVRVIDEEMARVRQASQ